jgi:hypothetical protein
VFGSAHHWAVRPVQLTELSIGLLPSQAVRAHKVAHNGTIFLFYKALVILEFRASSRERNVFPLTRGDDVLLDELLPVISIDAQDRERKERTCMIEGGLHCFWATVEQRGAFGPSGGHVGEGERKQKATLWLPTAMSDQIGFQKARLSLIPLAEGAGSDA